MAIASLQAMLNLYTERESDLTAQDSYILMQITRASRKMSDISDEYADEKQAISQYYEGAQQYAQEMGYEYDSTEYQMALEDAQEDYEMQLEDINNWESELEVKKQMIETELQAIKSYKESYQSILKENVKQDFNYTQISGS